MKQKRIFSHAGKILKGIIIIAWLWASTLTGMAHEIQPAIADLSFNEDSTFQIDITLNLEAIMAEIEPDVSDTSESKNAAIYDRMRSLDPEVLSNKFRTFSHNFISNLHLKADGSALSVTISRLLIPEIGDLDFTRESVVTITGNLPTNAQTFTWGWAREFGSSIIRVSPEAKEEPYSAYLIEGQDSEPIPITGSRARNMLKTIGNYIVVGYVHIIPKGLDHILFVVGLFLLSTRLHPLLWQISAFTIAHTISLALGILGYVHIPSSIVEPLIALSIVYVCVENLFTKDLTRWRPFVVFLFGLLHGLGFAGVLRETGLPADQFVVGLISFNVGVELGQLSVIALCFISVGLWFSKTSWYRGFIVIPASLSIGAIAIWWFIERTFLA